MAAIKYYNQDTQQWESVSSGGSGGSGDVSGPESNTNGQIAIFSGDTGKVIRSPAFHRWRVANGTAPDSLLIGEELQVNEIQERTAGSGVTVDNVLLKDGLVNGTDISALPTDADLLNTLNDSKDYTDSKTAGDILRTSSSATGNISPNLDEADMYIRNALSTGCTIANPTGSYVDGESLLLRIKDNGSPRSLSWGSSYRAIGTVLPTSTVASKVLYIAIRYNLYDNKWDVIAATQELQQYVSPL